MVACLRCRLAIESQKVSANYYKWNEQLAQKAALTLANSSSVKDGLSRISKDPSFAGVSATRSAVDGALARFGFGTTYEEHRRHIQPGTSNLHAVTDRREIDACTDIPVDRDEAGHERLGDAGRPPSPPETARQLPRDTDPAPPPDKSERDEEADRIRDAVSSQIAAHRSIPRAAPSKTVRRSLVRVIIPDSHGAHIDVAARDALLGDLKSLDPDEAVFLGDHLDCGGTFSTHQRNYTHELTESYVDDIAAANEFLTLFQQLAPRAVSHYIEGNHEQHVERWVSRTFESHADAKGMLERVGPAAVLDLKHREIAYYKRSEFYHDLSIPGCIRLGECFFVHGISHSKHASSVHLSRFGGNVVFGHVHRAQHDGERTVTSDGFGAWCPGTLAKLQPLYRHTAPSSWTHGYAVQFVNPSGKFLHVNVPIHKGESLLMDVVDRFG